MRMPNVNHDIVSITITTKSNTQKEIELLDNLADIITLKSQEVISTNSAISTTCNRKGPETEENKAQVNIQMIINTGVHVADDFKDVIFNRGTDDILDFTIFVNPFVAKGDSAKDSSFCRHYQ